MIMERPKRTDTTIPTMVQVGMGFFQPLPPDEIPRVECSETASLSEGRRGSAFAVAANPQTRLKRVGRWLEKFMLTASMSGWIVFVYRTTDYSEAHTPLL